MLITICIPCFKRIDIVRSTLKSIYAGNSDVSLEDYEVVISDNDPEKELSSVAKEFSHFPNLRYIPTVCEGFMNSYYALKYGKGDLLVLHNSQNKIRRGWLAALIQQARDYNQEKPLIFHSNGFLNRHTVETYSDFNTFMDSLSYWSSWSGGITIWKEDFDNIGDITIDCLFPHTSVFLTLYKKKSFIIDDRIVYIVQRVAKRGGHNKFEAFTIHYPSLVTQSYNSGHITKECKDHILSSLYREYIPTLLFNKYVARIEIFEATGFKENCKKYFPSGAYYLAWINVLFVPFRMIKRRIQQMIY